MRKSRPQPCHPYQFDYKLCKGGIWAVSDEERAIMALLYQSGKNTYDIGRMLDRTARCVSQQLKRANVKVRDSSHCQKKLKVNELYFESIDSPIKAYLLGFIYADGNVYKNRFKLALWQIDEPFLRQVAKEIQYNGALHRENKRGPNRHDMVSLTIYSRNFTRCLKNKGVIDNKTNKLTFPTWLRSELVIYFIHGLFDGDGCITSYRATKPTLDICKTVSFAGCYKVMKYVHKWFCDIGITGSLRRNKKNPLSGVISYSGTKAILVANKIYGSNQYLCLLRKRNKYIDIINHMNYRRRYKRSHTISAIDQALQIIRKFTNESSYSSSDKSLSY